MPKLTLLTWGFLILSTSLMGQNLDEFNRLVSKGDLPQDLAMSLEELQAEHHVNPEFKPNNPNERYLGHREQLNNALTREYLMGGDALFGDDVTVYLNEIAQVLLEDYPDWQDRIEVYSYRGMIGSAVSLENGRIFFNLLHFANIMSFSSLLR